MHSPPISIAPIVSSQGNEHFSIPVEINGGAEDIEASALVDSGAEGQFINRSLVRLYGIPQTKLQKSIRVQNVDGSDNVAG